MSTEQDGKTDVLAVSGDGDKQQDPLLEKHDVYAAEVRLAAANMPQIKAVEHHLMSLRRLLVQVTQVVEIDGAERAQRLMQWARGRGVPGNGPSQVEQILVRDAMALTFTVCNELGLDSSDAERLARTIGYVGLHTAAHDFDPKTTSERFSDYATGRLSEAAQAALAEIAAVRREMGISFGAANLGVWALQREVHHNNGSAETGSLSEQALRFDAWARAAGFSGKDHAALLRSVTLIAAERVIWLAQQPQFDWRGFERQRTVTLEQEGIGVLLEQLHTVELQPGDKLEERTDEPVLQAMQAVYERLSVQRGPHAVRRWDVQYKSSHAATAAGTVATVNQIGTSADVAEPDLVAESLPLNAEDVPPLADEPVELVEHEPRSLDPADVLPLVAEPLDPTEHEPLSDVEPEETRDDRFVTWVQAELGTEAAGCTEPEHFATVLEEKYVNLPSTHSRKVLKKRNVPGRPDYAHFEHEARTAMNHAIRRYDPKEDGHFVAFIKSAIEASVDEELRKKRRAESVR